MNAAKLELFTDASETGFGASWGDRWLYSRFNPAQQPEHARFPSWDSSAAYATALQAIGIKLVVHHVDDFLFVVRGLPNRPSLERSDGASDSACQWPTIRPSALRPT